MKKKIIKRDSRGNIVNYYGFHVTDEVHKKQCYVQLTNIPNPLSVALLVNGEVIATIDYSRFTLENLRKHEVVYSENYIWNYIYSECRKHLPRRLIFIDQLTADNSSVAGDLCDFIPEKDLVVDDYFFDREMAGINEFND